MSCNPTADVEIYKQVLESSLDSNWSIALPSYQLEYANKESTEKLLGYPLENFYLNPDFWFSIVHPDDRELAQSTNEVCIREGQAENKYRMIRQDGKVIWILVRLRLIQDEQGIPLRIIGSTMDVNDMTLKEQQLIRSAKMSSLGEMASGIAHEINNPLMIIVGLCSRLRRFISQGPLGLELLHSEIEKVESTAFRISKIIKSLKAFSRHSENDPMEPVRLARLIEETFELCRQRFLDNGIDLQVEMNGHGDLEVMGRPSQLIQVMLNLLCNAFDAVELLSEKWVKIIFEKQSEHIIISVIDSGRGIPADLVSRIMDPFFTTKESGKGTGLGLSISKNILEEHQGSLSYDAMSLHTCFRLKLPLHS